MNWIPQKELDRKEREYHGWDQPVLQIPLPMPEEPRPSNFDEEKTQRGIWTIDI